MTSQRLQLALNVDDLEASIAYYSKLFGAEVNKRKPGYANFAIENPPLKLVLFENAGKGGSINHLGVEVFDDTDVATAAERFKAEGIAGKEEEGTCCYAEQHKIWSKDPHGLMWEYYLVKADSETFSGKPGGAAMTDTREAAPTSCC